MSGCSYHIIVVMTVFDFSVSLRLTLLYCVAEFILPLNGAMASSAVIYIVSGSDAQAGGRAKTLVKRPK